MRCFTKATGIPLYHPLHPDRGRLQIHMGDVGANESASDATVFNASELQEAIENVTLWIEISPQDMADKTLLKTPHVQYNQKTVKL